MRHQLRRLRALRSCIDRLLSLANKRVRNVAMQPAGDGEVLHFRLQLNRLVHQHAIIERNGCLLLDIRLAEHGQRMQLRAVLQPARARLHLHLEHNNDKCRLPLYLSASRSAAAP
jgi:hypothetical protein